MVVLREKEKRQKGTGLKEMEEKTRLYDRGGGAITITTIEVRGTIVPRA